MGLSIMNDDVDPYWVIVYGAGEDGWGGGA